jgi:hypothetical protein
MVTIPSLAQTAGIPRQNSDTITAADVYLITGNEPAVMTEDLVVAASQTIPALSPVGFDGNGRLIPAVSGVTQAIGIAIVAITTDASTTYKGLPVYRGGCFNPDAIVWPASYDTEAEKMNAFAGAPSPTNIIMRRPKTYTV